MPATITPERPDTADASALIEELENELAAIYPSESRHGFSVEKLIAQGVAFFVIREDGIAAGCGGIMFVGNEFAELKRMYVRPQFRGMGLAKLMVNHLAEYAQSQGIGLLRLETGIHQHAAIRLYEGMGFLQIPSFGPYWDAQMSRCFEKRVE